MIKSMILAALAAVSVSAFAQDQSATYSSSAYIGTHPWCPGDTDVNGKSDFDLRCRVEKQANICLSGGDQFKLASMLDRNSTEINTALLHGLCHAERQAVIITSKILTQRFPDDATYASVPDNYQLQATTVTGWGGEGRPLRIVMTNPIRPKDISYDDALDILCMSLSNTQASIISDWWYNTADEGQKDVVVRLLKDDARMTDQTFYPSVYIHTTYSWLNDKAPF